MCCLICCPIQGIAKLLAVERVQNEPAIHSEWQGS
jgi:hypothetical protein